MIEHGFNLQTYWVNDFRLSKHSAHLGRHWLGSQSNQVEFQCNNFQHCQLRILSYLASVIQTQNSKLDKLLFLLCTATFSDFVKKLNLIWIWLNIISKNVTQINNCDHEHVTLFWHNFSMFNEFQKADFGKFSNFDQIQ